MTVTFLSKVTTSLKSSPSPYVVSSLEPSAKETETGYGGEPSRATRDVSARLLPTHRFERQREGWVGLLLTNEKINAGLSKALRLRRSFIGANSSKMFGNDEDGSGTNARNAKDRIEFLRTIVFELACSLSGIARYQYKPSSDAFVRSTAITEDYSHDIASIIQGHA